MNAFFSRDVNHRFGSFRYELGLVQADISEEGLAFMRDPKAFVAHATSEADLLCLAHEAMSLIHEVKHLHDCFGTLAGITLIAGWLNCLKEFAILSKALGSAGIPWKLPVSPWLRSNKCPQEVRDFVRRSKVFMRGVEIFVASVPPLKVEEHIREVHLRVPWPEMGCELDALALRINSVSSNGQLTPSTLLLPVGFEAAIEGNAQALMRDFAEHYLPESVAQKLVSASQVNLPYNTSDLFISKYLRNRGVDRFPRDLVLIASDIALSKSTLSITEAGPGKTAVKYEALGSVLFDLLERASTEQLETARLSQPEAVTSIYIDLLSQYEAGHGWETVEDDQGPLASINIWESYIATEIVIPLLRSRLNSAHAGFHSVNGALEQFATFGFPPVMVVDDKITFHGLPPRVQGAWWHVMMLGEFVRQLVGNADMLACPRAFELLPGLSAVNLAFDNNCDVHKRLGCGTWASERYNYRPQCLFNLGLKACAIDQA